jgi:hypothetical protein
MASGAGTLLADLDTQAGGGDGDLVQKILSDMNIPTGGAGERRAAAPPPLPAQTPIYQQQMSANSTQQLSMDSRIPQSHMIGNEHPTPADFASAIGPMQSVPGMASMPGMPGMPGMPFAQQQQQHFPQNPYAQGGQHQQHSQMGGGYEAPSKNLYGRVLEEMKVPFVVALLFFVFSLPPIRVLIAHYLPSLIKQTGEFQTTGLALVSLFAGVTFWLLQRVIAPLLSL